MNWGSALVAPVVTYEPEGNVDPAVGPHALRRNGHAAERVLHEAARIRGAQLPGPRVHRHRPDRRQRGNQRGMEEVAAMLNGSGGARAHACTSSATTTRRTATANGWPNRARRTRPSGRHAGITDTSLLPYVAPHHIGRTSSRRGRVRGERRLGRSTRASAGVRGDGDAAARGRGREADPGCGRGGIGW